MGLNSHDIKFLLWARESGVDFAKVMMIGRQKLYLDAHSMGEVLVRFGINRSSIELESLFAEQNGYAEPFFRLIGANDVSSIDASSYEGASQVLDMNQPVREDLKGKFTVVLDGGSLEHVFNFPVAVKNCMEMVQLNGHFIGITPCNNFMGHGFYQFSPELFFRIFTGQNGFKVEKMILYETSPMARWYEVRDPEEIGKRAEITTSRNTLLIVQARRTAIQPLFTISPQQSDYAALWRERAAAGKVNGQVSASAMSWLTRIKTIAPLALKKAFWSLKERTRPRINSEAFKEIRIPD